jgi:hypothetical protein
MSVKSTKGGRQNWRPVPGFEGYYEVSSEGCVRGIDRIVPVAGQVDRRIKGREMTLHTDTKGYSFVHLTKNGSTYNLRVHRLVMLAFEPRPDADFLEVNHLNGVKTDCAWRNLEWSTRPANILHAYRTLGKKGAWTGKFGSANPKSMAVQGLDPVSGVVRAQYESMMDAQRAGYNVAHVSACVRGKLRTHGGLRWQRV